MLYSNYMIAAGLMIGRIGPPERPLHELLGARRGDVESLDGKDDDAEWEEYYRQMVEV
jgi:hypothetical protein